VTAVVVALCATPLPGATGDSPIGACCQIDGQTMHTFYIKNLWNGKPDTSNDQVKITLTEGEDEMIIGVEAPFYNDPKPPNGEPGKAFFQLWDYEVVEAFFLSSNSERYLELEFGPHGQHLVLLLDGRRNAIRHSLPLEYQATIIGELWKGEAKVPKAYFPDGFDQWNAYSISGTGESRAYKSLFSVPGEAPDFHRIGDFQSLEGFNCLKTSSKGDLFAKSLVWVKEE